MIAPQGGGDRVLLVQYGVIPWRRSREGEAEILLITSRETRRWVVPRGNPIAGLRNHEAAAQEAYEEAGIRGAVEDEAIGTYRYDKRRRDGSAVPAEVALFRMIVGEEADEWPERHERERRWFSVEDAASAVDEAELAALIRSVGKT
jgi:8-oxo-dGTP pyrophosphatase MutT (NUDIX family)